MLLRYYNKLDEFVQLEFWTEYKMYPEKIDSPIQIFDLKQNFIYSV